MSTARDNYLATEVRAASPQKLQLLLVEGAYTTAQRAAQELRDGHRGRAVVLLVHTQNLVTEMIRQLDLEAGSELVQRVTAVYAFINRCLREGAYHHNREKVEDAIRILEIERETWRQVCRKLVDERSRAIPAPHGFSATPGAEEFDLPPVAGFSLEA